MIGNNACGSRSIVYGRTSDYLNRMSVALASGAAGPGGQQLGAISYLLVMLTGLLGISATLAWWRWADQTV